jgi:hypothetical protein
VVTSASVVLLLVPGICKLRRVCRVQPENWFNSVFRIILPLTKKCEIFPLYKINEEVILAEKALGKEDSELSM